VAAIVLALGSALFYGLSDFLGGLKSRSIPLLTVLLVSQTSALVALAAYVAISGSDPPGGEFLLYAGLAGVAEAIGVAALYRGLAVGVMSLVAPTASTAPVVPIIAGIALGELPVALQWVGIALAVTGIVVASRAPSQDGASARAVRRSLGFGLVSALGFGAFYVALDAASEGSIPWALATAKLTAVTLFAGFALYARGATLPARDLPVLALIGLLIVAADSMYAGASTEGLLSVVAVLSSLYPAVTIALARFVLKERLTSPQLGGVAAVLCGVIAISAG
jgi:drug/metabolite transporter (DMT)-like permease